MEDPYGTSLYLFSFFLIFFTLSISVSSEPKPYCSSSNCGNLTINYPFWKRDSSTSIDADESYCGYSNFGIFCDPQNQSILISSNDRYYVKNINYSTSTIDLVDIDLTRNKTCPTPKHNMTLRTTAPVFDNKDIAENITFYLDCTSFDPNITDIQCLQKDGGKQKSYMLRDEEIPSSRFDFNCSNVVVIPILKRNNLLLNDQTFGSVLNKGFQLEWNPLNTCGKCEGFDGKCGHNREKNAVSGGFVCYCKNGREYSDKCPGGKVERKIIFIIGIVSAIGILICAIFFFCIFKKCSRIKEDPSDSVEIFLKTYSVSAPKRYTYTDLKKITNSFQQKIGQGGYGEVFKGKLIDGKLVAIKLLSDSKGNGEEFINEVSIIGRIHHVNVVTLLGFCYERTKRALVYEFMPKGSLEKFIFVRNQYEATGIEPLGWEKLYGISLGIARGLEYLHRGCNTRILHFDIKPHNILLDEDFCPKISDFGLSKLYPSNQSIISTLDPRGTPGYIAPEVFCRSFGAVSYKSDVYSYGMMVLEMIAGRNNFCPIVENSSQIYFPEWIYKKLEFEPDLKMDETVTNEDEINVKKMIMVGLWCIQIDPSCRPSMSKVVEMLGGSLEVLQLPPKPFMCTSGESTKESFNFDGAFSDSDTTMSMLHT